MADCFSQSGISDINDKIEMGEKENIKIEENKDEIKEDKDKDNEVEETKEDNKEEIENENIESNES